MRLRILDGKTYRFVRQYNGWRPMAKDPSTGGQTWRDLECFIEDYFMTDKGSSGPTELRVRQYSASGPLDLQGIGQELADCLLAEYERQRVEWFKRPVEDHQYWEDRQPEYVVNVWSSQQQAGGA